VGHRGQFAAPATDTAEPAGPGWQHHPASTTSALGSGLATIAVPLLVASRTSNPLVVSASFGVAWLLFALPGGVLVDRVDRRRLMILIDVVRVAAVGVLATVIPTGRTSIALLAHSLANRPLSGPPVQCHVERSYQRR
jgi:MFS family permease